MHSRCFKLKSSSHKSQYNKWRRRRRQLWIVKATTSDNSTSPSSPLCCMILISKIKLTTKMKIRIRLKWATAASSGRRGRVEGGGEGSCEKECAVTGCPQLCLALNQLQHSAQLDFYSATGVLCPSTATTLVTKNSLLLLHSTPTVCKL